MSEEQKKLELEMLQLIVDKRNIIDLLGLKEKEIEAKQKEIENLKK